MAATIHHSQRLRPAVAAEYAARREHQHADGAVGEADGFRRQAEAAHVAVIEQEKGGFIRSPPEKPGGFTLRSQPLRMDYLHRR